MAVLQTFTREDVAKHNTGSDCYIIIHNQVYDITKYAEDHPGGVDVLQSVAGQDGTEGFDDIGHSDDAKKQLAEYHVGQLEGTPENQSAPVQAAKVEPPAPANSVSSSRVLLLSFGHIAVVLTTLFFALVVVGLLSDPDVEIQWALEQSIFFTASAPTYGRHVNLSPKGVPSTTFAIFDESTAGYLDLTGSGAETISHIYENGRVTLMFCSFTNKPRIMRLFCTGRVIEMEDPRFQETIDAMALQVIPGTRAVVMLDIWKVQTSCGYAVPVVDEINHKVHDIGTPPGLELSPAGEVTQGPCKCFEDRHMLEQWLLNKINKKALNDYMIKLNSRSLDGLPGLLAARRMKGEWPWVAATRLRAVNGFCHPLAIALGILIGFMLAMACSPTSMSPGTVRLPDFDPGILLSMLSTLAMRLLTLAKRGSRTVYRSLNK